MSKDNKRQELTFPDKIKFRQWIIENHTYIVKNELTREKVAHEATIALGFTCTPGHLPGIISSIDLEFHWQKRDRERNTELIDKLGEQMGLMEIGITDINGNIAKLQSEYTSLAQQVESLRKDQEAKFLDMQKKIENVVTSMITVQKNIEVCSSNLARAMDAIGYERLDANLKNSLSTILRPGPKKT